MRLFGNAIRNDYGQLNFNGSPAVQAWNLQGTAGSYAQQITNVNSTNNSYGLYIKAGTSSTDNALLIQSAAGSAQFSVRGDGQVFVNQGALNANAGFQVTGSSALNGNLTVFAPTSGQALAVNNNGNTLQYFIVNATGGVQIANAPGTSLAITSTGGVSAVTINSPNGTTISALQIQQGALASWFLQNIATTNAIVLTNGTNAWTMSASGGFSMSGASDQGAGSVSAVTLWSGGSQVYPGIPVNSQAGNYTTVAADNGRCVLQSSNSSTITIANQSAGYAVSVAVGSGVSTTIAAGSGVTLTYVPSGVTGSRTLTGPGVATIYFPAGGLAFISGPGIS